MNELLYSPKIKPEHLARKAIVYFANPAKSRFDKTPRASGFSTTWPSEYAVWAGRRSK